MSKTDTRHIAKELVYQNRKGIRINKEVVNQLSESLYNMFQASRKNYQLKVRDKMEVNTKKRQG